MASTDSVKFDSHSQYDIAFLRSEKSHSEQCIVDWAAAQSSLGRLAHAINGDPRRHWDFLTKLPGYGQGLTFGLSDDGRRIELHFPEDRDDETKRQYQLARDLVDLKCTIYTFAGLDADTRHGGTRTQVLRFHETVSSIISKVDRGNRWQSVAPDAALGMTILQSFGDEGRQYTDNYVMQQVKLNLARIGAGIDVTLQGFRDIDADITEAIQDMTTLSGRLTVSLVSANAKTPGLQQDSFVRQWGQSILAATNDDTFKQLNCWRIGWSKIQTNLETIRDFGSKIQEALKAASLAADARLADPHAATEGDGLYRFYQLFNRHKSNISNFLQSVDEVLIINWQYFVGPGGRQNPVQEVFIPDIDFVLAYPLDSYRG